jgi:transposase
MSGFKLRHAAILLKLDDIEQNSNWTQKRIAEAYSSTEVTVGHIARRFVEEGLESALNRKPQQNRARKVDGDAEAKIVALVCGAPPQGQGVWTLRLLRDEVVRLEILPEISHVGLHKMLKKTNLSLGKNKNGVSPAAEPNL